MEKASATLGVEPEPSTGTSTDPSGSSPPQVLRTYHQHMTDYMRLMMESGMDLTLSEDRVALLITEVYSSHAYFIAYINFQSILNSLYSQFHTLFLFSFRPYRRFDWPTTSTRLQISCTWMVYSSWRWLFWVPQPPAL